MITILHDIYKTDQHIRHEFEGPLIDFLTEHFPEGFGSGKSAVFVNQEQLAVEDFDTEVEHRDNVVIITTVPEGTGAEILIIQIIVAVVLMAANFLLMPKAPKQQSKGGRTYDINSGQNIPALGQPIAEHFGQTWFYPDVASQPYTYYDNNEQYLHEILLIGAGDYRIDGIRFGETDLTVIPPGLIDYRVFPPQEVQNRYGYIYSQYGVREDVITSTDVQGISLTRNANASWFGKRHNSEAKMKGTDTPDRFTAGQQVELLNQSGYPRPLGSTVPIDYISGYTVGIDFQGTSSTDQWWQMVNKVEDDGWRGWFTATIVGKKADVIVLDFLMPNGCFWADAEGATYAYTVEFVVAIQQIDDNDNNIGAEVQHVENITAKAKSTLRRTFTYPVTLGRYKVRVIRWTMDAPLSRIVSELSWTALKAIAYNTPNQYAYGNVTLLAVKVKASERLSSRSDKISVQATRILPTVESDFTVKEPTVNPVDAFAHVINEVQADGLDMANLKALGVKWANTNGFNYRFTDQDVVYSALQKIAYSHRATPEAYAYKMGMRQDVAKPFDQFIVSNEQMLKDSYKTGIRLAQSSGVIDGFRVGFQDPTGVRQLFAVYPSGALTPTEMTLDGCTSQATALQQGAYLYAKYLAQGRVVEFSTEWDALAFSVGDRVSVLNSVIDRASTARVVAINGQTLTLDAIYEAPNVQVKLRDQYGVPSDILQGSMTGNQLTLADPIPFPLFDVTSGQDATTVVLATTKDYARSYVVQTLTPDAESVSVTCLAYSDAPYQYPIPGEV